MVNMTCNQCGSSEAKSLFVKNGYELVECLHCHLAYIANPPTAEQLSEIYSTAADYHQEIRDPSSKTGKRMGEIADRHLAVLQKEETKGRVLDVGCSIGLFVDRAKRAGFDAEGIEFSEDAASFARDRYSLKVATGSIHDMKGEDGQFDIVTMFDVIEHVPDPSSDMAAAWRLLKPGGLFLQSTPNIDGFFPKVSYPVANKVDYWTHPEPPHHLYQFSVKTLTAMLEKSGFEVGETWHFNMDLSYSFGSFETLKQYPKMLAYAALFAPSAKIGPWIGMGDWIYTAARKPR